MTFSPLLSLVPGCRLRQDHRSGPWWLAHSRGELLIDPPSGAVAEALRGLWGGEAREEDMAARVSRAEGYDGYRRWYRLLFELHEALLLRRTVRAGGSPRGSLLASCLPLVAACPFSSAPLGDRPFVLSRFAYLRRRGKRLVIESPLALARIVLHHTASSALLAALDRPTTLEERGARADPALGETASREFCELLHYGGFLSILDDDGVGEEDRGSRGWWEFHDLLAHSRGRAGRHDSPYGGVYRQRGIAAPLPALKPRMAGKTVELLCPDLARLTREDPSLTAVMEARQSRRAHGEPAISLEDLSELLFRVARADGVSTGLDYEVARRVYPGGGAAWELELYLVVDRCRGLASGLYHYRPGEHQLTRLSGRTAQVDRLLSSACQASMVDSVQVLLVISARFGRVSWKYGSMAYATVLKDVGVLMQTLYLSASAMDLCVCAIGGGNADLFAGAVGTDYLEESSVGEMILGRGFGGRKPAL